jgi:phosphoenolpyruvate-protein kinase (PTS system EI component)
LSRLERNHSDAGTIKGLPISSGTATGTMIREISSGTHTPSVLLVDDLTTATVIQIVSLGACAVLAKSGGTSSHGAIFLRHRGIPCIVLPAGFDAIPSGSRLEVNGTTGRVRWGL